MTKPRIFINMTYMELGGAERALLGLLNTLDTERVDVDLFINQHTGEFMRLIPDKINLLPEIKKYSLIRKPISEVIKRGEFVFAALRLLARRKSKQKGYKRFAEGCGNHFVMDQVIRVLPSLHKLGEYDLAISFIDPSHIIHDKVLAKKRIEWLHTDFTVLNMDPECVERTWGRDDYIVAVSHDMAERFKEKYPQYASKVIVIENIISPEVVKREADGGKAAELDGFDGVKLLSVGRICYEKNFERIPDVAVILKQQGMKFKWFVVGPGDPSGIMQRAEELGVADCIAFLGKKNNPYPYFKACDLYLQPSRREGKCVTVREAQILAKPVIITRYPTSGSQLTDGVDGVICEMDNESVARAILDLYNDKEKQQRIVEHLKSHDYGDEKEVEKIYQLIENH